MNGVDVRGFYPLFKIISLYWFKRLKNSIFCIEEIDKHLAICNSLHSIRVESRQTKALLKNKIFTVFRVVNFLIL